MKKMPIILSNLCVLAALILSWLAISPGGFELGKYKIDANSIRFTPATPSYLQHDYFDHKISQQHSQQFKDDDFPRRYNFSFDEKEPSEGPKSIFIPSASDEAVLLFNGVKFGESEDIQLFAPGLGRSNIFVDIPRYALTPGSNRTDLHYKADQFRAGLREIFIGPTDRLNRIQQKQMQLFSSLPKLGLLLSFLASILCVVGVLFSKFGKAFAILGGVSAILIIQFVLSLDLASWVASSYFRQLSIILPLAGLALLLAWWFSERGTLKSESIYITGLFLFAILGQLYGIFVSLWPNPMPGVLSGLLISLTSAFPLVLIWPFIHILVDLSERRSIIEALAMQVSEQEKLLDDKSRLIATEMQKRAVLEERQRFTRDIHDGIGGQLLSLLLKVRSGRVDIKGVASEIQAGINDLRLVVDAMDHTDDNLSMALGTFKTRTARQLDSAEVKFVWDIEEPLTFELDATRDILNLYRLLQEAVSNSVRHANPEIVQITIKMVADALHVDILDDGAGFDTESLIAGKGLKSMRERAKLLGADLDITSSPESGTRLKLILRPRY